MVLSMDDAATRADRYISPKLMGDHKDDGMEKLMSPTWSCLALTYGNILHITHEDPIKFPHLPHMERHPRILETLIPDLLHKERSLLLRDLGLLLATI